MNRLIFYYFAVTLALLACNRIECVDTVPDSPDTFDVTVGAGSEGDTKLQLEGRKLSWTEGDRMGIFVDGLQWNRKFSNVGGDVFEGTFKKRGEKAYGVNWYAYSPYVKTSSDYQGTAISAALPSQQTAPFDGSAYYMVSSPVFSSYDEEDMPGARFEMSYPFFGVIKISVTNSNDDLKDEKFLGVRVSAANGILAGNFSFDVTSPQDGATFSSAAHEISNSIDVNYDDLASPTLGVDISHTIYAVVNPVEDAQLKITVRTTNSALVYEVPASVALEAGKLSEIPVIDIGTLIPHKRVRTLLYWGDSIATKVLADKLQSLLGNDWNVVLGGISGDNTLGIAGRQGGIPMLLKDDFTIPGNPDNTVEISGIYSSWSASGTPSSSGPNIAQLNWYTLSTSLFNPCEINGEKCVLEVMNGVTNTYYLRRLEDGDPISVESGTEIKTFANETYKDADMTVVYMGANGQFNSAEALGNMYQAMADHTDNHKIIVLGFHSGYLWGLHKDYPAYFNERFGSTYLNLRDEALSGDNPYRLNAMLGLTFSQEDLDALSLEEPVWPPLWQRDNKHPTDNGARIIKILVYERLRDLGYLEYDE